MAKDTKPTLDAATLKKAAALNTTAGEDHSFRELAKMATNKLAKVVDKVVPDDPTERFKREAKAHVNSKNNADKVRYLVKGSTSWAGGIVRGIVKGVYDSAKENLLGKPSKCAGSVLRGSTDTTEDKPE